VLTRGFISDARKMEDYLVKNSEEKLAELAKKSTCRKVTSIFMSAAAIFVMK
jgi:universal stress protein G